MGRSRIQPACFNRVLKLEQLELGNELKEINVVFTSRSHPAGVTHGGSLVPSVTSHCISGFQLVYNAELQLDHFSTLAGASLTN